MQLVNAVSATVSPGEAARLAANPAVAQVVKNEPIPLVGSLPSLSSSLGPQKGTPLAAACAPDGRVQLDPQAVQLIHAAGGPATAQALGYTGAGVKVAFIADGLDIKNPDFVRPDGQPVFVDYQDFSGTGTSAPTDGAEAFLDASSIAAQGRFVYNVQSYGAGLPEPCNIRVLGVAPGASLVGLNVFGSSNFAFNSVFLEAINYAVNVDHVNVLNESFGDNPFPDQASLDLIRMADQAAAAAGVTVTVSTGDAGVTNTIGSPATDPAVISAGASTSYRAYAQTGIGGINFPGVKGWIDNNISALSGAGSTRPGRRWTWWPPATSTGPCALPTRRCTRRAPTLQVSRPRSSCKGGPAKRLPSRPGWPPWSSRPTKSRTWALPRPLRSSSRSSCPRLRTSQLQGTSRGRACSTPTLPSRRRRRTREAPDPLGTP